MDRARVLPFEPAALGNTALMADDAVGNAVGGQADPANSCHRIRVERGWTLGWVLIFEKRPGWALAWQRKRAVACQALCDGLHGVSAQQKHEKAVSRLK